MGILSYHNKDQLNKPETREAPVYAVQTQDTVRTKEQLVTRFPNVFNKGVAHLDGEYTIRLDPNIQPVQHTPR